MQVRKFGWPLLVMATIPVQAALAQGVFNMGGLTQTLSIPAKQRQARDSGGYRAIVTRSPARRPAAAVPVTAAARASLSFRRDPALSERLKQRFLTRFDDDPKVRAEITRNWANITPKIVAALKPVGMQYTNLADAQATYLVTMWQAAHRQYTDNPAQFRAVSRQMAEASLNVGAQKMSNADEQEIAEMLLYEAVAIGSMFSDARTDKDLQRGLVTAASKGSTNNFGFDVANLRMTSAGLTP